MARILLADQDDVLRGYLSRRLTRMGHGVLAVTCPREAVGLLMPGAFDILIVQAEMDGVDGPEFARRAAAAVPGLRIFFLEGFRVLPLKEGARTVIEDDTLEPAFHLSRLVHEIDNLLAA